MSHINAAYTKDGFPDVDTAKDAFATQFNLDQPDKALSSYQRIMLEHTRQQFDQAAASSRRRSSSTSAESAASAPAVR